MTPETWHEDMSPQLGMRICPRERAWGFVPVSGHEDLSPRAGMGICPRERVWGFVPGTLLVIHFCE